MSIDNAAYVSDMNINSPFDADNRSEGAGQIRSVKSAITRTFKWLKGEDNKRPNLPIRTIVMYGGTEADIELGWALCDGRTINGITTPDLRGRFMMGATAEEAVGKFAGENKTTNLASKMSISGHAITISEMPSHTHNLGWVHKGGGGGADRAHTGSASGHYTTTATGGNQPHAHGVAAAAGGFDNRPAYYTVSYIMFVGMYEKE